MLSPLPRLNTQTQHGFMPDSLQRSGCPVHEVVSSRSPRCCMAFLERGRVCRLPLIENSRDRDYIDIVLAGISERGISHPAAKTESHRPSRLIVPTNSQQEKQVMPKRFTRREILKSSVLAGIGGFARWHPSPVKGQSPNEKLNIACVGLGLIRNARGTRPVFGWLGSRCEERAASPQTVMLWGLAALDPSHRASKDAVLISAPILSCTSGG